MNAELRPPKKFTQIASSVGSALPGMGGDMAATQYPSWGAMYVHVSWLPSWCTRPKPLFSHVPVGFGKEVHQAMNVYKKTL